MAKTDVNQYVDQDTRNIYESRANNKILQKEYGLTEEIITKDIKADYVSLSKYFPSEQKQKENFNLVKQLYKNNLNKYSDILTPAQIKNLKDVKFTPVKFDNLYLKDLMLEPNTSMIIVFGNEELNISEENAHIVNFQSDIKYYIKSMYELKDEHKLKIIAYCIMNNHAHLLIQTEKISELSKYMQRIHTRYGMYYNKKYNRVGYVFRDRFKTEEIYTKAHLINCIKYIF